MNGHAKPILVLGTIALSGLALSGHDKNDPDRVMFVSPDQCTTSGVDKDVCETALQDAVKDHLQNAPRFDSLSSCETQYGTGLCSPVTGERVGTTYFMPLITGFMLSSSIHSMKDYVEYKRREDEENSTAGGVSGGFGGGRPVYRDRSGRMVTTERRPAGELTVGHSMNAPRSMVPVEVSTVTRNGFGSRFSSHVGS